MAQKTSNNILQISKLRQEIELLHSFVIGIAGRDEEGEYRPEFVKRVLKTLREKPDSVFKNKKGFLAKLRKE